MGSRNNSEASDSSRRSNNVDIPPRFRRQVSNHDPLAADGEFTDNRSGSESPHLTIMKRKDSVKSEDDVFKKHDTPSEKVLPTDNGDEKYSNDKSSERGSRHGSSASLYKETVGVRSERQKRYSSSSDTHEKDKNSVHGSSSSIHKESEKKEENSKAFPKNKELKDLSETRKEKREREKAEKAKKGGQENNGKDSDTQKINSGRFAELKLSKGQSKPVPVKEHVSVQQVKKEQPPKTSPWSNVVSGKPPANSAHSDQSKSLRDIQLEEEEKSKMKKDVKKSSSNMS